MGKHNERRQPDEIESDIYATRARLDDTLHELEERFSPHYLMDTAFNYVRQGGANDVMAHVGRTVKRNPIPVMLTGIGLGWLMLSQRNSKSHADRGTTNLPVRQAETTSVPATTHEPPPTQTMAQPPRRSVGASATEPGTTGAGTTSTGKDPASVGASATGSPATPPVGSGSSHESRREAGKAKARHMTDNVKGRAQHMNSTLRERASHARSGSQSAMRNAGYRAQGAGEQTTHFIQEHPIVAGAIGVAIGAALGSLFPPTRIENERVGRYRDRAMHKAAEAGQQQADRAQSKMHEQVDKAQNKVHEKAEQAKADASSSEDKEPSTRTGSAASPAVSGGSVSSNGADSGHPPARGG